MAAASGEEVDNRARTKVLMQQEQLIREEREEVAEVEEAVSPGEGRGGEGCGI